MDARSIAATALNGGAITPATDVFYRKSRKQYRYDGKIYQTRIYRSAADPEAALVYGPNIADWPEIPALKEHLLLKVASVLTDPVTTTDELIPSGETSSYRSNPYKLAEFALSRKDPAYVSRAKAIPCGGIPGGDAVYRSGYDVCERRLRGKARRRIRARAGGVLSARAGRRREYCAGIRDQALSEQSHQLGNVPVPL